MKNFERRLKFCKHVMKTGKRKGQQSNKVCRKNHEYCASHVPKEKEQNPNTCICVLTRGNRKKPSVW